MDFLWDKITEWLKEMLVSGVISNLTGMFDATNQQAAEISGQAGMTPQIWSSLARSVFSPHEGTAMLKLIPISTQFS